MLLMLLHISGNLRNPIIDEIEEYLYDVRLRWTMPNTVDERIVIVDVDERSIASEGHFPWQRDKLARVVDTLFDHYEVRVLAFDMVFAEPEESTALQLISQLREIPAVDLPLDELEEQWRTDRLFAESVIARNVILGFVFKDYVPEGEQEESGLLPMPTLSAGQLQGIEIPFYEAAGHVGNFAELQSAAEFGAFFSYPRLDDVTRITPLFELYKGDLYEALGMAAARLYLGNPPIQFEFGDEEYTGLSLENVRLGDIRIPVDARTQVYIPFRGPQRSIPYVSATDVLSRKVPVEQLRDKLVLFGTSAVGLLDLRATPVADAYVGVEIHANLASGILDGRFKSSPAYTNAMEAVQIAANLLLMAALIPAISPALAILLLSTLLGLNIGFNLFMWNSQQLILPIASVLTAIMAMVFLQIIYDYFIESRRKQRLGRLFGQYIPAELVEEIDESGEELSLEGENREMTVLFSDVRGFTGMSEGLEPTELTRLMNDFLTPITRIIHDHRGTIDKYMGDAVMAFWGAPLKDEHHAQRALDAAMDMLLAMQQVTGEFTARGWPAIKIGIGISSGPMNVGNMGSEFRMAYTVLGDTVNLGSRLEGQTKTYGVDIIVSDDTAARVTGYRMRELDLIRVKGKQTPVTIFEPIGREADITEQLAREIDSYHRALELYRSRDFAAAAEIFRDLQSASPSILYDLYLQRIDAFLSQPPHENWDGVFIATSK
jgi:adenylate cyclase